MIAEPKGVLRRLLSAALAAADPAELTPRHLPPRPRGRIIVVGAGKAAAAMARATDTHYADAPLSGAVVTRKGYAVPTERIEVIEADHPFPVDAARHAAERILALAGEAGPDDLVLALISGGASALLALPAPGLTYDDTLPLNAALAEAGASIAEINTVRKHLSGIKAGRLGLAAAPAPVTALAIADIGGDDEPSVVGSGPTLPDPTTRADARAVLDRYHVAASPAVLAYLEDPANETPKPGDPGLLHSTVVMVSDPEQALKAAAAAARSEGVVPVMLGPAVQGNARDIAAVQASLAQEAASEAGPVSQPRAMLSGGITSVTERRGGRGGRNTQYLLALAVALDGDPNVWALACDTDGIDGIEDNAGAIIGPDTLSRAAALGLDPRDHLDRNDAYSLFEALGDLIVTGPTLTNVNDFRATLIT